MSKKHDDLRIVILEQLARYKFLTYALLIELGLEYTRNYLSKVMSPMTKPGINYVGQAKFGYHPKYGQLPDVFYLKRKGKNYLIKEQGRDPEDIYLPR